MAPRDPGEQDEHDRVEADTVIHARTATTRIRRMLWEQRLDRLPQLVPHPPNRARHRHLLAGLCHPEGSTGLVKALPSGVLRQVLSQTDLGRRSLPPRPGLNIHPNRPEAIRQLSGVRRAEAPERAVHGSLGITREFTLIG